MAQALEKKGDLMVLVIDVTSGKIKHVIGAEKAKATEMEAKIKELGFPADEVKTYEDMAKLSDKPADEPAFILHTHSSPGCVWVYQDGWWRKVCN